MKKLNYAYDVLHYEIFSIPGYELAISIKKYRLKSRWPLITAAISRVPLIEDFSEFPENYDELCTTVEFRLKYSLPLCEMVKMAREMMRDRFLQPDLPLDKD